MIIVVRAYPEPHPLISPCSLALHTKTEWTSLQRPPLWANSIMIMWSPFMELWPRVSVCIVYIYCSLFMLWITTFHFTSNWCLLANLCVMCVWILLDQSTSASHSAINMFCCVFYVGLVVWMDFFVRHVAIVLMIMWSMVFDCLVHNAINALKQLIHVCFS